jgi:predicted DNA-binding protein (MmcQ/YjbR family)
MNLEILRELCLRMSGATEGIKWEKDLCFMVGEKMFLITVLDASPTSASFKVKDEDFERYC